MMGKYQIFISYRRSGGEFLGKLLSDDLKARGYEVFFDVDDMHSGMFNRQIKSVIEQITDVVVVLSAHALDRCGDENDWVRQEIEWAMYYGKNIVPVLTRDFVWPEVMPETLAKLRYYHGITIQNDTFVQSMENLCQLLACRGKKGQRKPVRDEEELELENGDYYMIKTPLRNPFKSNKSRPFYGDESKLDAEAAKYWSGVEYRAALSMTFADMYEDVMYEKNLQYPWFVKNEEGFDCLRQKCLRLTQYCYLSWTNTQVRDFRFYKEFVAYSISLWRRGAQVHTFDGADLAFCRAMGYVFSWDFHEAAKAYGAAKGSFDEYFEKYMFACFEDWPNMLLSHKGDMTTSEKREYSIHAILLFDAMLEMYRLFFEIWKEPQLEMFVRNKLLCTYKYLKKNKIYFPKDIQKKAYELFRTAK